MTHQILDRVQETTVSTGTGALTLAGATTRMLGFSAAGCSNGDTFWGLIEHTTAAEWEIALCTYNSGAITRASPLKSSTGAAVSFSAGTKTVTIVSPSKVFAAPNPVYLGYTDGTAKTYTPTPGAKWLRVVIKASGGGGGGAANGTTITAGTTGGDVTFNGLTAKGGKGAGSSGVDAAFRDGGKGGTGAQVGNELRTAGAEGGWGAANVGADAYGFPGGWGGGQGGGTPLRTGGANAVGPSAPAGTGAGGAGGYNQTGAGRNFGAGGGEGETVEQIISSVAASYSYTIPDGGAAGTSDTNGGKGGSGFIYIEEHFE